MVSHKLLEKTIGILIDSYPFFACLVQRCSINWTATLPTAAVRVLPSGGLEMVINPEFFCQLTPKERVGLVLHEMLHLTNDHLSRSFGLDPQIANIAMDTSINQHIPLDFLPPGACLPDNVVLMENKTRRENGEKEIKLDNMMIFENYYNILKTEFDKEHIKKMQNPHKFDGQLDQSQKQKSKKQKQQEQQIADLLKKEKELEDEKSSILTQLAKEEKEKTKNEQEEIKKVQDEISSMLEKQDDEIKQINKEIVEKINSNLMAV